jgi:hypothetical protein
VIHLNESQTTHKLELKQERSNNWPKDQQPTKYTAQTQARTQTQTLPIQVFIQQSAFFRIRIADQ